MSLMKEFREFALKGNVVDMAVGIVIGAAFGTVVKSLVDHVIMPPIGFMTSGVDFANLGWTIQEATGDTPAVMIGYGAFLNAVISFVLVALALFFVVKAMNRVRQSFEREKATPSPTTKKCSECQMEIPINARRCGHCTSQLAA